MLQAGNEGDGSTIMAVGDEQGRVVIRFPNPKSFIALDPDNALKFSIEITDRVNKIRGIQAPNKAKVIATVRDILITRTAHILRTARDERKDDPYTAAVIVDRILSDLPL